MAMTARDAQLLAATEELYARRQARNNLIDFTTYTYPNYKPEPVHDLIAEYLDGVVAGDITRLMIVAPPQHGKSELVSVRLPAFWLGKRPNDPIILTSYGARLAENKSRQARDIIESPDYAALFGALSPQDVPVDMRQDSRAVNEWRLANHRGGMIAAGAGGPITGHGAMLGIIDDPFENWEQAQSLTYRNRVDEWFRGTFRTRIWEGGAIVLIMTRWHEDDLVGRLLARQGDKWEILRLPALAETQQERDDNNRRMGLGVGLPDPLGREPGEPLAPKRFSEPALQEIKIDVGGMVWGAEYQGAPRAPEGNRIKRAWLTIVEASPAQGKRIRYWDKAGTDGGGAYTAGVLVNKAPDGLIYIEDVVRGQWEAGTREKTIRQTAEDDQARYGHVTIYVEQEPGSSGKEAADFTIRNLAGFTVRKDPPSGSKDVRLEPFIAQAEAGNVRLVRGHWNADYIEELTLIPNSKYRDQADATSGAINKLPSRREAHAVEENPLFE
ncbi:MAG: phage terminase large subunit [Anaerolineae bacterium]